MAYATVLVNLTLGRSNTPALAAAVAVAGQCRAGIIGIAACRPIEIACRDYAVPAALYEEDRKQAAQQMKAAEVEFQQAVANLHGPTEWRARTTALPLADHLLREARGADLIVAGAAAPNVPLDVTRQVDLCDLVMGAGRPVLLVPDGAVPKRFERILVAWKDTPEAQRAITSALPLLANCRHVSVVEITPPEELAAARTGMGEIMRWLGHHEVKAAATVTLSNGANAKQLRAIARDTSADLVVAGAYGYRREHEWVLGGVTADLLAGDRCVLFAH
ncbi:Universal stress protein family protein [Rhodospirillales bacterium URHD0017]|nr:Universal stress protein family protein [Rhodospirillales bacterium URHD0017]